ncbi:MAG: formylglycine-generating enzyme family protein [Polyangiaceae bacterium]
MRAWSLAVAVVASAISLTHVSHAEGMRRVGPGDYTPVYARGGGKGTPVQVALFELDVLPVTNREYLAFAVTHPEWRRDRVARIFADAGYLSQWEDATHLGARLDPRAPVVEVSWFAARAFCRGRAARLPTEAEWELAAKGRSVDGGSEDEVRQRILDWYARPAPLRLPPVGSTPVNEWGIGDLHGLVWEWVSDFNSVLVGGDPREAASGDRNQFCGAGALGANDTTDYAAFMRVAFRSALRADYTTRNLGFRCARTPPTSSGVGK